MIVDNIIAFIASVITILYVYMIHINVRELIKDFRVVYALLILFVGSFTGICVFYLWKDLFN